MDANYLLGYKDTIGDEGCTLEVDKDDNGGRTWKGISQPMHPNWSGWFVLDKHIKAGQSLAEIKQDKTLEAMVQAFYYKEFWLKLRINEIKIQSIQLKFFNTAVNVGLEPATKFQQASVNLPQTGIVDNALINALNA